MKKQIVIATMIVLNLIFLIYQLSNQSGIAEIINMKGKFYPFSLAADNENIYFIGIEFAQDGSVQRSQIYQMKSGESSPQMVDIKTPDDMLFYKLCIDCKKNLHIFLCDDQNERCEIWEISQNKEIIKKIDVAQNINQSDAYGISSFAVDNEGRYYLREYAGNETIILKENGIELCRIEDGNRGFQCLGNSRNGKVSILFNTPEINPVQLQIASVNLVEERLEVESTGDFLPLDDIYSVLDAGEECDFLIRGMRGAYKYNLGEEKGKKVIDTFSIGKFDYNSSTSCFLSDDKLLMIAKKQRAGEEIQYGDIKFCYYAY